MALELEPVGIIFTEIRFMNHRVERRAKLQRNRKIFRQKGTTQPSVVELVPLNELLGPNPAEMGGNVAAWSRLMKRVNTSGTTPNSTPPVQPKKPVTDVMQLAEPVESRQ